jgi:hypothetical protein
MDMMQGDVLRLEYVPISQAVLFDANPKLHDIGALAESIRRHGYKDPVKFEPSLNGGSGGIVEGNGRITALTMMRDQGQEPPRGIALTEDGEWAVPVLFGVDAASEATAQAYAVDHNLLVMAGGRDFTAHDYARLWDEERYLVLLQDLARADELPVGVDGDDLDALLSVAPDNSSGHNENVADEAKWIECPECSHKWKP